MARTEFIATSLVRMLTVGLDADEVRALADVFGNAQVEHVDFMMGEVEDSYSHAINTAIYGALFSIVLDFGLPADVALAALLHDIGLVDIEEGVALKPVHQHDEIDTAIYRNHVDATVTVMQEHKLTVMPSVMKAVVQHHEYYDSSGYPAAALRAGLSKEAQMLALADHFDYSTRLVAGPPMTAVDYLEKFRKDMLENGRYTPVDPELVRKLLAVFDTHLGRTNV